MAVLLTIKGRVQGVAYRAWMVRQARAISVSGWVRNRADGSVEALIDGPVVRIAELIGRCWEGPPAARVDQIIEVETAETAPAGFLRLPDA